MSATYTLDLMHRFPMRVYPALSDRVLLHYVSYRMDASDMNMHYCAAQVLLCENNLERFLM